ncbi:MAG: asparagine synthase (glutamine-hydrolyzing) [Sphingomicrobium sp.]
MCGIAGLWTKAGGDLSVARAMADTIAHRGPDDDGVWTDEAAGIALAHRRLAIIDLSASGHQPMMSKNGRFVIVYNGEVYNHAALRRELDGSGGGPRAAGMEWEGHSDTETLIECIAHWGVEAMLKKAIGMFAFALWDKSNRSLTLARDRFGEKPLYYGWSAGTFVFASELKAIRRHPRFDNAINREALRLLASRTNVPAPLSIFENIYKLDPGCILVAQDGAHASPVEPAQARAGSGKVRIASYWTYRQVVAEGLEQPYATEKEAMDALEAALGEAVASQAVADVPVGTFLSGGIDSSTVAALLQRSSPGKVSTFSIGFEQDEYNEAVYAKAVAQHLGTDHHEQYVTVAETRDVIPLLPTMYDEPFADSSQIPTYLVSKMARRQVTVALSGDGGDELFGGYNRYFGVAAMWGRFDRLPGPVRRAAGASLAAVPPPVWNNFARLTPLGKRPGLFGTKVQRAFRTMSFARGLPDMFNTFMDEWAGQPSPVLGTNGSPYGRLDLDVGRDAPDVVRMMYCDATGYLPDDILTKVDRASMAVSLETRVPFLDPRVAAVAARIPLGMKVRGGAGKWILKELLFSRLAPRQLFDRPKAGFRIPVADWIRGPLKDWGESLLSEQRLRQEGYLDPGLVRRRWQEHQAGKRDATQALWPLLMFQAWLDAGKSDRSGAAEPTRSVTAPRALGQAA